jgi:hypothetical protein
LATEFHNAQEFDHFKNKGNKLDHMYLALVKQIQATSAISSLSWICPPAVIAIQHSSESTNGGLSHEEFLIENFGIMKNIMV